MDKRLRHIIEKVTRWKQNRVRQEILAKHYSVYISSIKPAF
jgi:hypothetical protein